MRRVIVTTGGTGGHIFPALAVAEELRARHPQARVLFVGGVRGPEARLAAEAGLEFAALPVRPVLGRGLRALAAGWWLLPGLGKALVLHGRFKPQVVVGLGGYAAFASVLAAVLRRTPTAIHEQNSVPGLTNRLLGRLVDRVMVSFPDRAGSFPATKVTWTGNPVRKSIVALARSERQEGGDRGKRLLVLGGSQGAVAVNDAVLEALPRLRQAGVEIRHQTGAHDYERVTTRYATMEGLKATVEPFIQDMAEAYAWAGLALCRAGATTVAELAVAGVPSVLIPFPHATHQHQSVNARFLEQAGAARCIEQSELPGRDLAMELIWLLENTVELERMAAAARAIGKPMAAAAVVDCLEELAGSMAKAA